MMLPKKFQFLGFVAAGGTATVINYGLFLALFSTGNSYLPSAVGGYLSGIAVSFALNRWVVYGSSDPVGGQFFRYFVVYLLALGVQLFALESMVQLGIDPRWANGVAIAVVVALNFFAVRRFVFSPSA